MSRFLLLAVVIVILTSAGANAVETPALNEQMLKVRDPFRRPMVVEEKQTPLTELERIPVEDFKMIGMISGPERVRAMIRASDGKTYFVSEKMRIGVRKGVVTKITPRSIHVREQVMNVLGQEEASDTEIKLSSKNKN